MRPPDRIRIRLLGGFEVARDDGIPIRLSTKKVCALVAFLAMSRKHAATREELATLLWGSCSEQQARQSLRQALVLLRKDLHSSNVLSANADMVQLQPGIWSVDALEFEKLADSSKLEDLERATELLGGEFLAGLAIEEEGFDEWLRAQRSRFQMVAGRVLSTYAERTGAAGNGQQAIAAVERLLALDPLREDWQRLALRLYARHRGQHEALAQAKAFEELLRRESDVHPEAETRALVEEIRSGDIAFVAAPAGGALSGPRNVADGASTPATLVDEETRQADISQQPAPRHRWVPLRQWPARRVAALSTIAGLMLVAGVLGLTRSGSVPVGNGVLDKRSTELPAPIADPWQSPRPPSQAAADPPAGNRRALTPIIVLPFTTYGDSAGSTQLMADMMTDDLTNMLSRVSGLRVISRQTARRYQGTPIDVAAIGADLGIRYVLEGSMRMRDDKLRVSVELVDPKTRLTAWSGRIERDGADRQAVQDEIVGRLARELQFEVFQAEGQHGSKEPGVDELIFRGWAAQQAGGRAGVRALKEAEGYFLQALERDPRNIRALVGLAAYHVSVQFDAADPTPHLAKAEELLRDALHRFPNDAGAFYFMGVIHRARGKSEVAVEWFERAVAVNPSHAPSYSLMGASLTRIGRASDGLEYIKYAMRLSPRDPALPIWLRNAGETELELGHHDQAIEYFRRSLALHPRHAYPLAGIAAAHALAGRMPEAHEYAAELKNAAPHQSRERLLQRFAGDKGRPEGRLVEGLRLALDGD